MQHLGMTDLTPYPSKPFLDFLTAPQIADLKANGRRRRLSNGQFVHSRGDEDPGISLIESGAAQAGIYAPNGGFILTSFLGPGQTFGEFTVFTDLPRSHDISALGETTLIDIPAQRFLKLCEEDPGYLIALTRATLMRSHILLEMLHALRILPLVPRVAKYLLILTPDPPSEPMLRFRQSDLAATLGLSRASMHRALAELSHLGLIDCGYGSIRIPSVTNLGAWLESTIGET